jgi:two-component system sensor histidine kinase CpxA
MAGMFTMFKRVPLGLQILAWFFLNLALVCLVGGGLILYRFGGGFEVLLDGSVLERIDAFRIKVYRGLNYQPSAMWNEALAALGETLHVEAAIFSPQGEWRAGRIRAPTPEVLQEVDRLPPTWIVSPQWEDFEKKKNHRQKMPGLVDSTVKAVFPKAAGYSGAPRPFFLKSGASYWIGVRLPPIHALENMETSVAYSLLLACDSLRFGGLVIEDTPILLSILVLGGSALFWIPLVRGITRPIFEMEKASLAMAGGNFSVRVCVDRADELGRLAGSINALAADFNERLESRRRFLGDIAHELSSPLARMQWAIDVLENELGHRQGPILLDLREEVSHMITLVEELLNFNKSLSPIRHPCHPSAILALVHGAAAQESIPAASLDVRGLEGVFVHANAQLMIRAVANVLRNCRLYAPDSGPIRVTCEKAATHVTLHITDGGPGVPADVIPRLGEPFFRADSHRSRETGGTGLGLSIVKRCVEACDGTVQITHASPHGLTVSLTLRLVEEALSEAPGENSPTQ